jgi:hypothetical protein
MADRRDAGIVDRDLDVVRELADEEALEARLERIARGGFVLGAASPGRVDVVDEVDEVARIDGGASREDVGGSLFPASPGGARSGHGRGA